MGRATSLLAAAAMLAALSGCGLFDARNPRTATNPGIRCRSLTSPDSLVANVEEQYGTQAGVTCFSTILDDAYAFHPDLQDSIDALPDSVYRNWNRNVETRVATGVAADAVFFAAVFDSEYATRSIPDQRTEIRFYAYHVLFRPKSAPDTTRFQGKADLTFHQDTGIWHVTSWVDKRDGTGLTTWGVLRRNYRIGF